MNVGDQVVAEWTWGGSRYRAAGVVTKVSAKTVKVRLTEDAGAHFKPGFVVTTHPEMVRPSGGGMREARVVSDFNTLNDLIAHAASDLGATHVSGTDAQTKIFFPRGGTYPYEEATVWRKNGYWHTQGPGAREGVRALPRDARPIASGMRRAAETRKPTIYDALRAKLGREPTNAELKAEVDRIKREALIDVAGRGGLPHQRGRRVRPRESSRRVTEMTHLAEDILDGLGPYLEHEGHDAPRTASSIERMIMSAGRSDKKAEEVLDHVNKLIGGHGVEAVRDENAWDNYYGDVVATYVNMGDTYDTTLVHDARRGVFEVTSWGDWYEQYERNRDEEEREEDPEDEPDDEDDEDLDEPRRVRASGDGAVSMYQDAEVFINGKHQVGFMITPSRGIKAAAENVSGVAPVGALIEVKQDGNVWRFINTEDGVVPELLGRDQWMARYVHKIAPRDTDVKGPFAIPGGAFSDKNKLGAALRKAGVLSGGARVRTFRVEGDKVIVFPSMPGMTTYWHSIVLYHADSNPGARETRESRHVGASNMNFQQGDRVRIRVIGPKGQLTDQPFWYTVPYVIDLEDLALQFTQTIQPGMFVSISDGKNSWTFQKETHGGQNAVRRTNKLPTARYREKVGEARGGGDKARGAQYAADQLEGDYFRQWAWGQMVEGAKLDPDKAIHDLKQVARNMLQDVEWDTKRDLQESREFFEGFTAHLRKRETVEWLTKELEEMQGEIDLAQGLTDKQSKIDARMGRAAPRKFAESKGRKRAPKARKPAKRKPSRR